MSGKENMSMARIKKVLKIAHRGGVVDEQRSENSIKALNEAIQRGYTHVEIDARITMVISCVFMMIN